AVVALVDRELSLGGGPPGTAAISRDEPGDIRIVAQAPARQLLVLSERFNPGWVVRVDGRPGRVVRAYGDFMGCEVGPGRHMVHFRYRPRSLAVGRPVSLICSALAVAWPLWARARSRTRRTPPTGRSAASPPHG